MAVGGGEPSTWKGEWRGVNQHQNTDAKSVIHWLVLNLSLLNVCSCINQGLDRFFNHLLVRTLSASRWNGNFSFNFSTTYLGRENKVSSLLDLLHVWEVALDRRFDGDDLEGARGGVLAHHVLGDQGDLEREVKFQRPNELRIILVQVHWNCSSYIQGDALQLIHFSFLYKY